MNETLNAEINTAKIYLSTVENVSTIVDVYQSASKCFEIFIQIFDPSAIL